MPTPAAQTESALYRALARLRQEDGFGVTSLRIHDFRGLRSLSLEFPTRVTVVIGSNGAGKSSMLDVIRISLSWLAARIASPNGRGQRIEQEDIHHGSDLASCELSCGYSVNKGGPEAYDRWTIASARTGSGVKALSVQELTGLRNMAGKFYLVQDQPERPHPLPVLAYFGIGRSVVDVPRRIRTRHNYTRLDTYEGALSDGKADFRKFFEWFREREDAELEMQRRKDPAFVDRGLEATRTAIARLMPGYGAPFIRRRGNVMLLEKEGAEISVGQLSDGERTLLTMVADLARRCAMATENTDLHDTPLSAYGTVLIDEIELHLHPGWQQLVISQLLETFPKLQFIVTTHSPLVLSTVPKESIRILHALPFEGSPYPNRVIEVPNTQSQGLDTNDILSGIMKVSPDPNLDVNEEEDQYRNFVQEGNYDSKQAIVLADRLREHYGANSLKWQSLESLRRMYERRDRIAAMKKA